MSNYIAVDLKVIEVLAPMVARGAGITEDRALAGLVRLWHRCWSTTSAEVTLGQLAGVFGGDRINEIAAILTADFLEPTATGYRVRGAERYLRLKESRREGALKTNALRATARERSKSDVERTLPDALSPSTEHRAPNTEKEEEAPRPPPVAAFEVQRPDLEAIDSWSKEDFWRAAEITRREAGYPPQKWPNPVALSRWWGESRGIAEVRELAAAFTRFAADKHWRATSPPAPFAGFMAQWSNFLPRKDV